MGLTNMNNERAEVFVGKEGTGKTTKVRNLLPNALYMFANDVEISDIHSVPKELGIIIEDIHYKPMTKEIVSIIRSYRGKVLLTSRNQKSIPAEIKRITKMRKVGSKKYVQEEIKSLAPRSEEPFTYERDIFSLMTEYLRDTDREKIRELLLYNKPADTQVVSWLAENIHPNKIIFVDGVVKRRWSQRYFYEMLAYSHNGKFFRRPSMPKRGSYSKVPKLLKRVGLQPHEKRLFVQLLEDEDFYKYAKSKYNNEECRLMGLGEKRKPKERKRVKQVTLGDFQ